jgi:hypothetical protein
MVIFQIVSPHFVTMKRKKQPGEGASIVADARQAAIEMTTTSR